MEIQQLSQSEFAQMLKSTDEATQELAFQNDAWYEQVTVGEVTYRHKLLSLKKTSSDLLYRTALESQLPTEPIRLPAYNNGPIIALVFHNKSTVYYHLLPGSKSEMTKAKRMVIFFAKKHIPQQTTELPQNESVIVID